MGPKDLCGLIMGCRIGPPKSGPSVVITLKRFPGNYFTDFMITLILP